MRKNDIKDFLKAANAYYKARAGVAGVHLHFNVKKFLTKNDQEAESYLDERLANFSDFDKEKLYSGLKMLIPKKFFIDRLIKDIDTLQDLHKKSWYALGFWVQNTCNNAKTIDGAINDFVNGNGGTEILNEVKKEIDALPDLQGFGCTVTSESAPGGALALALNGKLDWFGPYLKSMNDAGGIQVYCPNYKATDKISYVYRPEDAKNILNIMFSKLFAGDNVMRFQFKEIFWQTLRAFKGSVKNMPLWVANRADCVRKALNGCFDKECSGLSAAVDQSMKKAGDMRAKKDKSKILPLIQAAKKTMINDTKTRIDRKPVEALLKAMVADRHLDKKIRKGLEIFNNKFSKFPII